jgi:hypothetical protein
LAQNRSNGTRLEVFSGKEARLNRVILQILRQKGALIPYDVSLNVKRIKNFMHTDPNTVYRRMEAQEEQGWIGVVGSRLTQPGWCSDLYGITLRGKAALRLDEWNIEDFLRTATDEQLTKFIDVYS